MPSHPPRRLIQGQGGSTLIELLVAMPIAVMLLGLVVQALGNAGQGQQDIERRTEALTQGQIGLERMTREIRQADWVFFRSSSLVDLQAPVRPGASASSVPRLVRYDCTGEVCSRSEGAATAYPPPAVPTFTRTSTVVGAPKADVGSRYGQITGHDIFRPSHVDSATGARTADFLAPDYLQVSLRLAVRGRKEPVDLEDGVNLRNRTTFAG